MTPVTTMDRDHCDRQKDIWDQGAKGCQFGNDILVQGTFYSFHRVKMKNIGVSTVSQDDEGR